MNDETAFLAGTEAECNRCKAKGPTPKPCVGHLETYTRPSKYQVYRLDTMCVLPCGHMDAHWVTVETVNTEVGEVKKGYRPIPSKEN